MSETLERIKRLASQGEVVFSLHGKEEMEADGIAARTVVASVQTAVVVEDYPDYWKGPAVLVLQWDTMETRFTWSGASSGTSKARPPWSPPTTPTRPSGAATFCGDFDEQQAIHQADPRGRLRRRG